MASLNTLYIKKETLQTMLNVLEAKNQNGIEITISIADEVTQHGTNVSAFPSQSKEDREAKKPRFYIGNGLTFWTDGKIQALKNQKKQEYKEDPKSDGFTYPTKVPVPPVPAVGGIDYVPF